MSSGRQDWELADGPVVGQDVPITGQPREENASGEPLAPEVPDGEGGDGAASDEGLTEKHEAPEGEPRHPDQDARGDADEA